MASQPPSQPPESIVVDRFTGIKNTVAPERLKQDELEIARNIDIDDMGQVRRRRGYVLKEPSSYHSGVAINDVVYCVKSGMLGVLGTDYTFTPLTSVGPHPLSYTNVGETIYFSSLTASGKIIDGEVLAWGAPVSEGQWVSPVMRPTETLGAIAGQLLGAPPMATDIEYYRGRIYMAHGSVVWATELYKYDLVDKTKNYLMFEHDVMMVQGADDGLYIGTKQNLFFLQGTLSTGFKRSVVLDTGIVPGSALKVPVADFHPDIAKGGNVPEGSSPMFLSNDGICLGLDAGQVYNLTRGRVVFPGVERVAALYRQDQGANAYLAVMDSAGGVSGNMRFGDFADAEIVRAAQRGL